MQRPPYATRGTLLLAPPDPAACQDSTLRYSEELPHVGFRRHMINWGSGLLYGQGFRVLKGARCDRHAPLLLDVLDNRVCAARLRAQRTLDVLGHHPHDPRRREAKDAPSPCSLASV